MSMTIDEFNKTKWLAGMTAKYHGDNKFYHVAAVNFSEMLVGLLGLGQDKSEIYWARCENVTIKL